MEMAAIVGLVQGCSPTHVLIANWIWPCAFSRYSTRNTSVWLLQSSDKMISFWTVVTIGVQNLSHISKVHCKKACLFLYHASKWHVDHKRPRVCSAALLIFLRFLYQISDKFWIISLSTNSKNRIGTRMARKIDPEVVLELHTSFWGHISLCLQT